MTQLAEQRMFTAISLSAFKNHTQCFGIIYRQAMKGTATSNLYDIKTWVNQPTDEKFTALHFASYHGNFELIKLMVEEMGANVNVTNIYGANCLHIAA